MENNLHQIPGGLKHSGAGAESLPNEQSEARFAHIKGWGIDADPKNEPTYPMKHWNGDDHKGLNYERPSQQRLTVEKLKSNERPTLSAVFGTSVPPAGVSGDLRRYAFRYSEGNWTHWLALLLADRINMVEGLVADVKKGDFPNLFKERGWGAEWKYNREGVIKKLAIGTAVTVGILFFLSSKNKRRSS